MLSVDQRQDLTLTLREFSLARNLPSWVFASQQLFTHEMAQLFGTYWFCVGHRSGFEPGSVSAIDVGQHALLISCNSNAELRAFHNVCRHRGTRLVKSGPTNGPLIVCPYHGWSYRLDGSLKAAPGMDAVAGFCAQQQSLLAAELSMWEGFVFVRLAKSEQPPSTASKTSPEVQLAEFPLPVPGMANLQPAATHQYQVAANWKLLCENYNECYHCPAGHPELHAITRPAAGGKRQRRSDHFTGGPMELRSGFNTMNGSGRTTRGLLPGWPTADQHLVHYYHLFPNLFLSAVPDYVMIHLLFPVSHDQVNVQTHWLFDPAEARSESFDPSDAVDFWDRTNQQDWRLCEQAQRGHQGHVHRAGFYHPSERCVHDFDRWYANWLCQLPDLLSSVDA